MLLSAQCLLGLSRRGKHAPCSLHTTLQKDLRSWRLPGWGPFGVESTARLPSELGFMISHRGQVAARSLLRWVKSSKPFCVEVCVPSLTPELWHPRFVVRTRKGPPKSGPLTCAHVLLLVDSPLSSLSCFFSSCPSAASSVQVIEASLSQLKNHKK